MNNNPRTQLIKLLNTYLSRPDLYMRPVMRNMAYKLTTGQLISLKQFQSIIKWVERDIYMKREELLEYFSPVIKELQPQPSSTPTLQSILMGET